jgi:hypothetical protein
MAKDQKKRIIQLRKRIVANFTPDHWAELGVLTDAKDLIDNHNRLIRSLQWDYPDYADNVLEVLAQIANRRVDALDDIEDYMDEHFPEAANDNGTFSIGWSKQADASRVFMIPDAPIEPDLAAIIIPFDAVFAPVSDTLKAACSAAGYRALRADDIWEESTIMQEIFNLLCRCAIVISDFTGKNPNVMYETGVAHTLGKLVIPISQTLDDTPFDLRHHRIMEYEPSRAGLVNLQHKLTEKLMTRK